MLLGRVTARLPVFLSICTRCCGTLKIKTKHGPMKGGGARSARLVLHNDLTSSAGDQVTLAFRFPLLFPPTPAVCAPSVPPRAFRISGVVVTLRTCVFRCYCRFLIHKKGKSQTPLALQTLVEGFECQSMTWNNKPRPCSLKSIDGYAPSTTCVPGNPSQRSFIKQVAHSGIPSV